MADPHPEQLRSQLLEQDPVFQTPRYQEHRMQLEQQLLRAQRRERVLTWVVTGAFLTAVVTMFLAGSRTFGSPDPFDKNATIISVTLGVIYVLAQAVFFIGMASYLSRFLPRIRRLREELRDATIRESREEIRELREEVGELRRLMGEQRQPPESGA
jgi:hypothetical protein